jgi:hypothetical protein
MFELFAIVKKIIDAGDNFSNCETILTMVRPLFAATRSRTPSLHAPLLLCLTARGLILELLPFPRSLVVLPVDHVRVDVLRRPNRPMPSHADTAGSGTPLANKCEQWECLNECRLAPFASLSRRTRSDSAQGASSPGWAFCVKVR